MPLLRKHKYHRFYGEAIFQRGHRIFYAFKAPQEWHLNLVDIRNGATWPLGKVRDGTLMGLTKRSCYIHGETWVEFRRKVLEMWRVESVGTKCYTDPMNQNIERNKDLVLKRLEDPIKWSYRKLGKHFHLDPKTVHEIFKRDVEKYGSKGMIKSYKVLEYKAVGSYPQVTV